MYVPSITIPQDLEVEQFWQTWKYDSLYWVRHDAPPILASILIAVVLIELVHLLTRRLLVFAERETEPNSRRRQQLRTLATIINSVGLAVIIFVAALQILPKIGLDIGPLLASAGIAGLAIGFGAQTLVKDVINGFFILVENQYDIGDIVKIGGVQGTVETMTLRRTVLRDGNGSVHIVPNSAVQIVSNLTRDWTQVSLHVAIAYKEPSDKVIRVLKEVGVELKADPDFAQAIVADPEVPGIERVSSGEVDYLMLVKTRPSEQYRVSRELRRRIKDCLHKNNIEPARPAQLYVMDPGSGSEQK